MQFTTLASIKEFCEIINDMIYCEFIFQVQIYIGIKLPRTKYITKMFGRLSMKNLLMIICLIKS